MKKCYDLLRSFGGNEDGATAIEYAIIAAGLSIAIAATLLTLGPAVKGSYDTVNTALK